MPSATRPVVRYLLSVQAMKRSTILREVWDATRLRLLVEIDRRGSVSAAPGAYLLPDVLGCFRREYPGVTVEVEVSSSGDVLRPLLEGRVQLAVVGAQTADRKIVLEPFLEDEIVGIARPGVLPLVEGALAPAEIASLT